MSNISGFHTEISGKDFKSIKEEVLKDIKPIREEDFTTSVFLREIMYDYRINYYLFLKWVRNTFSPYPVLYPACGFDVLPKLVFGKGVVIHTSLEELNPKDRKTYFPYLGEAITVIADNRALPFIDSSFQAIIISGISADEISDWTKEFHRVLAIGGMLMVIKSALDDINIKQYFKKHLKLPYYIPLHVPGEFQNQGPSKTEFFLFRKNRS